MLDEIQHHKCHGRALVAGDRQSGETQKKGYVLYCGRTGQPHEYASMPIGTIPFQTDEYMTWNDIS